MQHAGFHPIRVHGRGLVVVLGLVLVVVLSLARPVDAAGPPVDPVPVGVWPLQPRPEVVQAFDPPEGPFGSGHRGVDLAGTVGQQVLAALAGRITYAGPLAGRGVVVVDHGATRTTYEPVVASVRVGDVVARGQPIGVLELTGSHCLPRACLHWGWRRGATYLDPLLLVRDPQVRLLPLWTGQSPVVPLPTAPPVTPPFAPLVESLRRWSPIPAGPEPGPRSSRHPRTGSPGSAVPAPAPPAHSFLALLQARGWA